MERGNPCYISIISYQSDTKHLKNCNKSKPRPWHSDRYIIFIYSSSSDQGFLKSSLQV